MRALTEDRAAFLAIKQCGKAMAELAEFACEGEASEHSAFDDADTCEMLADALRTTLEIDLERERRRDPTSERGTLQAELIATLNRFLEGWA